MKQKQNIDFIKNVIKNNYAGCKIRFIKLHGSKYQPAGLPDIMCLIENGDNLWLEVKRNWKDKPTDIQKWNVDNLKDFNFKTGFVAGKEYKQNWNDTPILFEEFIWQLSHHK